MLGLSDTDSTAGDAVFNNQLSEQAGIMKNLTLVAASILSASFLYTTEIEAAQRPNLRVSDISTPGGICKKKSIRVSIVNSSQTVGTNERIPVKITVKTPGKKFTRVGYRNGGIAPNTKSGQPVSFKDLPIDTTADKIEITAHVNHNKAVNEGNYNDNKKTYMANCVPDTNQAGGGDSQCDLYAKISGSQPTLPGKSPAKLTIQYENIGSKKCAAKTVELYRYKGSRPSGSRKQKVGQLELRSLKPGKKHSLRFEDNDHPETGKYTYGLVYVGGHTDGNSKNHRPFKTITFKKVNTNGGNTGGNGVCDLSATLDYKALSSSQREWKAKFKNIGGQKCPGNNISLSRYQGKSASGYGVQIGGSGNLQKLRELGPNKSHTLKWTESRLPGGTNTYKIKYSGKQNDIDNKNHHPTKTVTR